MFKNSVDQYIDLIDPGISTIASNFRCLRRPGVSFIKIEIKIIRVMPINKIISGE